MSLDSMMASKRRVMLAIMNNQDRHAARKLAKVKRRLKKACLLLEEGMQYQDTLAGWNVWVHKASAFLKEDR